MTTLAADPPLAAQQAAIRESGWGERYRFFQPHNFMFWVYLWLLVLGGSAMLSQMAGQFGGFQDAIVTGYVAFALFTIPFWLALNYLDRYRAVPGKVRVMAFLWGGLVGTFTLAQPANAAVLTLYAKLFGQPWAQDWGAGLTAPFTEEIAKGAGVLVIIVLAPRVVRSAFDGLIIGAFIGLGFQVFEDVTYVVTGAQSAFGAAQGQTALHMVTTRALTGLTSHTLYSALFGMGLVWLVGRPSEPRRIGRGLLFVLGALLVHGLWDAMGALAGGSSTLSALYFLLVPGLAIVLFIVAVRWSSVRPRDWMRDLLRPEAERGTISEDELTALSGNHRQRKAYIKAAKGHKSHVHARHVLAAATDLARQLARDGGRETPDVAFARAEVARVRG